MPRATKKQLVIAGTEPPCIPELDQAIAEYLLTLDEQHELARRVTELRDVLHGRLVLLAPEGYEYVDGEFRYRATLESKTRVKVKRERVFEGE